MAEPIPITAALSLDPGELVLSFVRSSGPGGQNVNKVATAVQLRFDLKNSPSLPHHVKARAAALAGSRLTNDGVIIISASNYRTQVQNRQDAQARLVKLLQEAAAPRKHRRKTKPTLASKRRRMESKSQRGKIKNLRRSKPDFD